MSSFVAFAGVGKALSSSEDLSAVHVTSDSSETFDVECCGSDWATALENSQLLLVQDLRVCKVLSGLSKVGAAYDLLRHHEVVVLRSVHTFRALNVSYNIALRYRYLVPNIAHASHHGWVHLVLDPSLSGHRVLGLHLRTLALDSLETSTHIHQSCLAVITEALVLRILLSKSAGHHVGLLRPRHVGSAHNNIVLLDNSDAVRVRVLLRG